MVYEYGATVYQRLSRLDAAGLESSFAALEEQARAQLAADGVPPDRIVLQRVADCRYLGQGYELRVDCGAGPIDEGWVGKLRGDFDDIHEREYSRRFEEADVEIPNVRVRGIGLQPKLQASGLEPGSGSPDAALRHEGDAWFRVGGRLAAVPTRFYDRTALTPGNVLVGPAIVNQYDSTTAIPPEVSAHVDRFGNIVIATGGSPAAEPVAQAEEVAR
jgi:N-methylhydantoinase A/oxoprolinase/acetone carboxylase beta subunit